MLICTSYLGGNKAENAPSTHRNNDKGEIFDGTKTWTDTLESRFKVPKETNLSDDTNNSSTANALS